MADDRARRAPSPGLCGQDGSRSDPLDSAAKLARCVRVLRAPGWREQLGAPGSLRCGWHRRTGTCPETVVGTSARLGERLERLLGDMAPPVSPHLAFPSRAVNGASLF